MTHKEAAPQAPTCMEKNVDEMNGAAENCSFTTMSRAAKGKCVAGGEEIQKTLKFFKGGGDPSEM